MASRWVWGVCFLYRDGYCRIEGLYTTEERAKEELKAVCEHHRNTARATLKILLSHETAPLLTEDVNNLFRTMERTDEEILTVLPYSIRPFALRGIVEKIGYTEDGNRTVYPDDWED